MNKQNDPFSRLCVAYSYVNDNHDDDGQYAGN